MNENKGEVIVSDDRKRALEWLYGTSEQSIPLTVYNALEAALQQPSIPTGWRLVPEEPTDEELDPIAIAVRSQIVREFGDHSGASLGYFKRIFMAGFKAMLAAAPTKDKE